MKGNRLILMPIVLVFLACGLLATPLPAPTDIPLPTPSSTSLPLTPTIELTPISGPRPILEELRIYVDLLPLEVEVLDIRYIECKHGEGTVLYVEARSTGDTYHATGLTITVVHSLRVFHEDGVVFRGEMEELHVVEYDKDLNRRGMDVVQWEDFLEWFEKRISTEELRLRFQRLP